MWWRETITDLYSGKLLEGEHVEDQEGGRRMALIGICGT
jgi:hypothetical protein